MRNAHSALLHGLLGLALLVAAGTVAEPAGALVFCAKNRNPDKIKVRGDACRKNETEVQAGASAAAGVPRGVVTADRIYVVTETGENVGLLGTSVFCDEGDVATGGGITSNQAGSAGPFLHYSGPLLDDEGAPVGWRVAVSEVNEVEIQVICADVTPEQNTVVDPGDLVIAPEVGILR